VPYARRVLWAGEGSNGDRGDALPLHRLAPFPVALTVLVLGAVGVRGAPAAQVACGGNLLVNPSFEAGFSGRGRIDEIVATGWTAWYERLPGVDGVNYVPNLVPRGRQDDGAGMVIDGLWSQEMSTHGATHTAGLWQRVRVPRASIVSAFVSAYAWASDGDDPVRSAPPGTYIMALGLDPAGGQDPNAPTILWTQPISVTDVWVPLEITADVPGAAVTFFTRGQPLEKLRHNVSRWDGACLSVVGPIGQPTPTLTPRPWPTRTPRPGDPTATPTTAPTDDPATRAALEVGLAVDAATEAAGEAGATGDGAPIGDAGTSASSGDPSGDPSAGPGAGPADDAAVDRPALGDLAGVGVFALAALLGGVAFGLGRRGGRGRPDAPGQDGGDSSG
jgi:hypothetical protein